MELMELVKKLPESKGAEETYVLLHLIGEVVEAKKDELKEVFTEMMPKTVSFPELGKNFNIMEMKKNTLNTEAIKGGMTDSQIRMVYKPNAKDLDFLGLTELKEANSKSDIQKQVRVTSLSRG